jgi:hypothetical protein
MMRTMPTRDRPAAEDPELAGLRERAEAIKRASSELIKQMKDLTVQIAAANARRALEDMEAKAKAEDRAARRRQP